MRALLLTLFLAAGFHASAQTSPLTFYIHDPTGVAADTPLPALYQVPSTPQGSGSTVTLKIVSNSASPVSLVQVFVTNSLSSADLNPNYFVSGLFQNNIVPAQGLSVTLHFIPTVAGTLTGYLQTAYQIQVGGCTFSGAVPANQCPVKIANTSTLTGIATPPQLVLSYNAPAGPTVLQPGASSPLNFGNVSTSSSVTLTFTLANQSAVDITTPAIALKSELFSATPFVLDTTGIPTVIPANSGATFTVKFAPGQTLTETADLVVGSNIYALQGSGVVITDIDALQIMYVDQTGVRSLPQTATPIQFGQLVAGASGGSVLAFTVTNPITSYNSVTLSALGVTGAAFAISGAPAAPVTINPGQAITFNLTFAATVAGAYTGTLSIGTRQFSLAGHSTASPLPAFSFQLSSQPLSSQQQVNLTIQFASASQLASVGTLSIAFKPSVANVSDDPAVMFPATGGRNLNVSVAQGAQTATYNSQSNIVFQTGTTAGTIVFTLTFSNTAPYTQSFTITPATIQVASTKAVRQSPSLVVTVNGYDNTYTAGQLAFTFYDLNGKAIASGIPVNAAASFQQLFFTNNEAGGAFALQASFPVTGDVTQVGSVAMTLTNSAGQTTASQTFQ